MKRGTGFEIKKMSSLVKVFLNGEKVKTFGNETLSLEPLITRLSSRLTSNTHWSFSVYDKATGRQPNHFKCNGYLIHGDPISIQYNKISGSSKAPYFTFDKCVSYLYINVLSTPLYDIQVWHTTENKLPSTEPKFRQFAAENYWLVVERFLSEGVHGVWLNDICLEDGVTEDSFVNHDQSNVNTIKILVKEPTLKTNSYFWWGQTN
jgi:hypothetical protein